MTVSNSSISNSELHNTALPVLTGRRIFAACLWALLWLILIDISLSALFVMPDSPLEQPSKLQKFFDHGRSVESKFRRMVGTDQESTAKIAYAGWLVEESIDQQPKAPSSPGRILVAAYGQSFTYNICKALNSLDPRFELRLKGGPAATLSHSHAFYKIDSQHQRADVVVLGILASSLPYMMAPTISTINFEGAVPYTYPLYSLKNEHLSAQDPIIHSLEELRIALWSKPAVWNEYLAMLRTTPTYNSWIFESDWFDYSSLARLVRRSIGQKHVYDATARYWNPNGFTNTDGILDVANALIADFAADVKAKGQIPYVLLIQDKGYKNHLALAFESQLKQLDIPYLSTHTIAPSTNARNFVDDGHFTADATMKIAQVFHADILMKLQKN